MKYIVIFLLSLVIILSLPAGVYAAGVGIDPLLRPGGAPTVSGQNPDVSGDENIRKERAGIEYRERGIRDYILFKIVNVLLGIAGIAAVFFIILNGFQLIISAGKEETITQHKKGLMWAVVGLLLIILSYSIIRFVVSVPFQADEAPSPAGSSAGGSSGGQPSSPPADESSTPVPDITPPSGDQDQVT